MNSYSIDQTPLIWLMMVVEAHPLVAGQTFQHKETLQICIAEEANLAWFQMLFNNVFNV
jgi:hypothetical protein